MDNRLKLIASYIEPGTGFADVGTDHGYIPAELAQKGYPGNIIATDINSAPLQSAVNTAKAAGVEDRIEFICCDGLSLCDPEKIDTIVIAGMGGDMICHILDYAYWCMDGRYKLILQPMTKAEVVRYWLTYNGFEIETEALAEDSGSVYQIIVARFGKETRLTDAELFTGKYELCDNKELFSEKLMDIKHTFRKAIAGMEKSSVMANSARYGLYRKIMKQLEEMGETNGCP